MALPDVIIVLAAAFTTALAALWWLSTNAGRPAAAPPGIDDMSLLFEDGELIHGSDSALTRFALAPGHHSGRTSAKRCCRGFLNSPARPGTGPPAN